jgi:hypothetical protein
MFSGTNSVARGLMSSGNNLLQSFGGSNQKSLGGRLPTGHFLAQSCDKKLVIHTDSDESIDFKAHEESKEIDKIEINELLTSMQGESRNVTNAGVSGLHSKAESSEIMKIIDHVSFTRHSHN